MKWNNVLQPLYVYGTGTLFVTHCSSSTAMAVNYEYTISSYVEVISRGVGLYAIYNTKGLMSRGIVNRIETVTE